MPVENRATQIGGNGDALLVSIALPLAEIATRILDGADPRHVTHVVIGEAMSTGRTHAPAVRSVAADLAPMTDAIKRVDGSKVVETVDRSELEVVGPPMIIPLDLARRWAAAPAVDAGSGRRSTLQALLSQLVLIEPDLRVVPLDLVS